MKVKFFEELPSGGVKEFKVNGRTFTAAEFEKIKKLMPKTLFVIMVDPDSERKGRRLNFSDIVG